MIVAKIGELLLCVALPYEAALRIALRPSVRISCLELHTKNVKS